MYTIQERRASTTFPASFCAAYNHYQPISRAHHNAPSYAVFPSTIGSSFCTSGGGVSSKAASSKEVISFHSSTKWRSYFEASKHSNKLIVMYFTATWCEPCRSMEPIIKELAAKHSNVDLVKIDVDELFNVSREFGVQTMPTFVFMKNGKEIDKVRGANKEELRMKLEKRNA